MRSILTIVAASALAACASSGRPGPGTPSAGILSPTVGAEASLQARYRQYRTGPPPHLDFESWKRQFGNPPDYSGSGP